jgi:hypothetical protein
MLRVDDDPVTSRIRGHVLGQYADYRADEKKMQHRLARDPAQSAPYEPFATRRRLPVTSGRENVENRHDRLPPPVR